MIERFPMSTPFGWFFVAYSSELQAGDVRPVHYFGRDFVLYRTEGGQAALADAYCPHLGAHLGHGGKIIGEAIECPFHGWRFDTQGACTEIPYARAMPPRARRPGCLPGYPVVERNQVVWAWHHPKGEPPLFEVIEHPEVGAEGWSPLECYQWRLASNPQEIAENGVDVAHFRAVHRMDAVPEGKTSYVAHVRRSIAEGTRMAQRPDGTHVQTVSRVETLQNGAGQKYTRLTGLAEVLLMVLVTPIEADDVELRFAFTYRSVPPGSPEQEIIRRMIAGIIGQTGVAGDIPIWHNKIHRAHPLLCDGDGPILQFRQYFRQFYVEPVQSHAALAG
jgi:phenylpropionate dioxygenase-like ring-hydroxylating dioxygenase large terminal subunit